MITTYNLYNKDEMKNTNYYIDSKDFTDRVYKYVCILNPVKFYNEIYRYHYEEITPIPVKNDDWKKSCDIYFEFKRKVLEKSKRKREENRIKIQSNADVDYSERFDELNRWMNEVMEFDVDGYKIEPQIPDDIGRDIMLICNKLASKYNFYQYTCKEDMVSTAVYKCCRYIGNFSSCCNGNALNYFTQIASRNFIKVINKEKEGWRFNKMQFERYIMDNSLQEIELNTFK